ncbi:MAG TPA: glucose-1-phosphate thymidylyltransferase [Thermoanaerobaculia bacterium]|jgi:glucose-1-phosphate thymidylyltransferase|nr:glucose-1-phosphate thymidylyltransferase [Thermoanaerobaculia bacterium]
MKGLILSGGKGTRLRPLTHTSAKQLVPVANKPVLFYAIEAIVAAGIAEIGIIVGDTRREIEAAVGDGSRFGARVTYIPQEAPLGLAHAVLIAERFLAGSPFVMYLGDNLIAGGIASLVEEFQALGCNSEILLAEVPNPEQFGVAELTPEGKVRRLVEKPPEPRSNLALVGVYMFDSTIFESVKLIEPSARGELEITDAIQNLIDRGLDVHPHIVRGWWKDTGKLEDMLEANRIVLEGLEMPDGANRREIGRGSRIEGRVKLGEGVVLIDSLVRGPVVIGDGARLENAFVGPYTSIGDRCTLVACEMENSIVLADSEIRDIPLRIDGSLIGRNVRIVKTDQKPKAYRFMVGDNSEVGIS